MNTTKTQPTGSLRRMVRRIGHALCLATKDASWPIGLFVAGVALWKCGVSVKLIGHVLVFLFIACATITGGLFGVMAAAVVWLWLRDVWRRTEDPPNVQVVAPPPQDSDSK